MASRKGDRHADALKSFEAAHALMGLPTTGIEVAREREALGLLNEALEMARSVIAMTTSNSVEKQALADASALAARVEPKIATLEIAARGPPAGTPLDVQIDGRDIQGRTAAAPFHVNPGAHTLTIGAAGYRSVVRSVTVAESGSIRVEIDLQALPPKEPGPAPPAPPAPNPAVGRGWTSGVRVHIESNDPGVVLYRVQYRDGSGVTLPGTWNGSSWTPGSNTPGGRLVTELACRSPCDAYLDDSIGEAYYLGLDDSALSHPFALDSDGDLWLRADVTRRPRPGRMIGGLVLTSFGALLMAVGTGLVVLNSASPGGPDGATWAGAGILAGGAASLGFGVSLFVSGRGQYSVDVPKQTVGSPPMLRIHGVF